MSVEVLEFEIWPGLDSFSPGLEVERETVPAGGRVCFLAVRPHHEPHLTNWIRYIHLLLASLIARKSLPDRQRVRECSRTDDMQGIMG